MSKRVSFTDWTRIWNEAYRAHVEGEWKKLQQTMNSTSIRSTLAAQVEDQGPMPSVKL